MFACVFRKSESRDSLLRIGPIESVRMQYSWALEFPKSNVCSTIGPGDILITKKCSANNLYRSPYKQLTWSIYVYCIVYTLSMLKMHMNIAGSRRLTSTLCGNFEGS